MSNEKYTYVKGPFFRTCLSRVPEMLGTTIQFNNPKLDERAHDLSQMIKKAFQNKEWKRLEKLKNDLEKVNARRKLAYAQAKELQQHLIQERIEMGCGLGYGIPTGSPVKVLRIHQVKKPVEYYGTVSPSARRKLLSKMKKAAEAKNAENERPSIFTNPVIRSLVTGWSNSARASKEIRKKLEFEFENPKGLSRCRCATSLICDNPMDSHLKWAIVFDPRDIIRGYKVDVMSHADGRKGRTRKCEAHYESNLIPMDEIMPICSGLIKLVSYPEWFIKPGAVPIGVYLRPNWTGSDRDEIMAYAREKGLKVF